MNSNERLIVEAITSMLQHDAALGLSYHKENPLWDESNTFQTNREQIREMFALKAVDLVHYEGVLAAFYRTHTHMFISDASFKRIFEKNMKAQGIPTSEIKKALGIVDKIIKELKTEDIEQDYGFNPDLDKIIEASKPGEE